MKHNNTLRNTALTLVNTAVETRNYITDVLHHIKASGVSEIIAAHEAGSPPDITAIIEQYKIPIGEIAYYDPYLKEITDGCVESAEEIINVLTVAPEHYAEALVQQLVFWEVKYTPLYVETFERRFPTEFRETSFYKSTHDTVLVAIRDVLEDTENYHTADAWARYHAFDTAEKHCLVIWMLTRHGYSADEVMTIFISQGELVREFCELVTDNNFDEEEPT